MSDVSAYTSSDGESRAARAYGLYASTEMTWTLIAEVVGYASGASAGVSARNHAKNNGLKWPLRQPGCRSARRFDADRRANALI